jgi:O-antigen biosynthesis protein
VAFEVAKRRSHPDSPEGARPGSGGWPHPERFDPEESATTLMGSEHRGRYWWAAQLVSGRSVLDAGCGTGYGIEILAKASPAGLTGVDLAPEAVAVAQRRSSGDGAKVVQGDLTALGFPDDSFDLAVCFETIEHLASPEQGIAELRRVVRPGGILVISSPNPDVYPSGNEHHLHELRPDELLRLVQDRFETARLYVQHAWLASAIEPAETAGVSEAGGRLETGIGVHRLTRPESNGTTFSIAVGCDGEPPEPSSLISLGDPFEVRWWEDRLSEARQRADASIAEATDSVESAAHNAVAATERNAQAQVEAAEEAVAAAAAKLEQQELEAARALREAEAREARLNERLQATGNALVDANQELAQMPLLKHRLAEMYGETAASKAQLDQLLGSRSWRITGFLRRLTATLKLQR